MLLAWGGGVCGISEGMFLQCSKTFLQSKKIAILNKNETKNSQ